MIGKKVKKIVDCARKVFVVDTNIILNDHNVPFSLQDVDIILPYAVIKELDQQYESKSATFNARAFKKKLKILMSGGGILNEFRLENGSTLILESQNYEEILKKLSLDPIKADNHIIASAYNQFMNEGRPVTLLTNDIGMWVIARSIGVEAEDFSAHKQQGNHAQSDIYSGVRIIHLEDFAKTEADFALIEDLYAGRECLLTPQQVPGLHPNQILVIKSEYQTGSIIVMFKDYSKPLKRLKDISKMSFAGIKPLNKEQGFAYEFFCDEKIACTTIAGRAGTGKSIVALSYAITSLDSHRFDRIMIFKPIIPVGKDLGYLPGTIEEKLAPWIDSFKDSFKVIFKEEEETNYYKDGKQVKKNDSSFQYLLDSGQMEFHPLTFMRGRSLMKTLVILDECQNTSVNEIKMLLTRIGEGSKVICLGDIDQVDVNYLSRENNGLSYLIERGREAEMIGHITFIKDHRSDLSNWAGNNL